MSGLLLLLIQGILFLTVSIAELVSTQFQAHDVTQFKDVLTNASGAPPTTDNSTRILWQHYELAVPNEEPFSWWTPTSNAIFPDDCPAWILDYADFHKSMLGKPDAQYIVNSCPNRYTCTHGLGDRLRGLLPTLQLAAAHRRVLLIHWDYPHPLDRFFQPKLINWLVTPDLLPHLNGSIHVSMDAANLTHHNAAPGTESAKFWSVDTNRMVYKVPPGSNITWFHRVSWDAHCIYRALFKPSRQLQKATDKVQQELLGNLDQPYVAVHLRMGHLTGENKDIPRGWDHFQGVLAAYHCATLRDAALHGDGGFLEGSRKRMVARALAESNPPAKHASKDHKPKRKMKASHKKHADSQSDPRILWLTDHGRLRHMIGRQMFRGAAGPRYSAHHYSYSKQLKLGEDTESITMSVFVDLMLLSRARCLVWSKSGFSKFAMAYGWMPCTIQIDACIKDFIRTVPA